MRRLALDAPAHAFGSQATPTHRPPRLLRPRPAAPAVSSSASALHEDRVERPRAHATAADGRTGAWSLEPHNGDRRHVLQLLGDLPGRRTACSKVDTFEVGTDAAHRRRAAQPTRVTASSTVNTPTRRLCATPASAPSGPTSARRAWTARRRSSRRRRRPHRDRACSWARSGATYPWPSPSMARYSPLSWAGARILRSLLRGLSRHRVAAALARLEARTPRLTRTSAALLGASVRIAHN